jgi:hypothetical protein
MPNIVLALDDVQNSVERPVTFDIIREIMEITQISNKTNIMFLGDEEKAAQQNSTISKDLLVENRWSYNEKVSIEVEEDFDKDRILSMVAQKPENIFIFKDENLPVYIKPVYSSTSVKLTVKYKARDKNQATRWRNDMRTRTAMLRDLNLHKIQYHYHLQEEYYVILKEIHRLREATGGYGDVFEDYFTKHLTTNASIVTNLNGQAALWAIAERQIRVQGYFEFDSGVPDKPDKYEESDAWETSYTYNFLYEKPIACNMYYPLMIHNQLLSTKYRPVEKPYKLEDQLRSFTLSMRAFAEFESDNKVLQSKANEGITIPEFDDFTPNSVLPSTVRVVTALTNVVPTNLRSLFNLKDLGLLELDSIILDFLVNVEYSYLGRDFQSIFSLSLYKESFLSGSGSLSVNNNLDVVSTADLDIRKTHRVRLGLVTDFSFLTVAAINRVRAYPLVAAKLIKAINIAITSFGGQKDILKNKLSTLEESYLLNNTTIDAKMNNYGRDDCITLVQTLFVAARRAGQDQPDNVGNNYGRTN